jgi:hypothetical protein
MWLAGFGHGPQCGAEKRSAVAHVTVMHGIDEVGHGSLSSASSFAVSRSTSALSAAVQVRTWAVVLAAAMTVPSHCRLRNSR